MKVPSLRDVGTEARLLLIGIPVFIWTMLPIYHLFLFAISPKESAFSGKLWPDNPTLHNFGVVFRQEHFYLHHFWEQFWNSLVIAVATGVITLFVATTAAFAISRLKVKGGRAIMNLALFTYFIPAAFLAVPMYRTMGLYGLLNSQWALILAMVTIAAPYSIWVLKQASDKLPVELDEAAIVDGASPMQLFRLVYLPLMTPSLVAVGMLRAAAGVERIPLRVPAAVEGHQRHARGRARKFSRRRRLALGIADDHRPDLCAAAGRDLLRLPPLHGVGTDRRRSEELKRRLTVQAAPVRSDANARSTTHRSES